MILAGKNAVVTGSSNGIGRAIASFFAAQGANVVLNARGSGERGAAALADAVDEARAKGVKAIGIGGAVDDPAVAEQLIARCVSEFGGIDILVNNAGIFDHETIGPVDGCSLDAWHRTVSTNLNGAFYTCRAALPHMKKQRAGRILNASSLAGLGVMGGSAYPATKAAVVGLTRAIAADYGPWGITANAYNPEAATDMGASNDPAVFAVWMDYLVDRGLRTRPECEYSLGVVPPEGITAILAYLCSDGAANLNGQVVAMEGRRIALLSWPEERRILYRDFAQQGPFTIEELERLAPLFLAETNRWPKRDEETLTRWEAQATA